MQLDKTIQNQSTSTIICSVCIATYRRPNLLKKLLISLEQQLLPESVEMEVIVVDNDANKSAEVVVQRVQKLSRVQYYYYNQPVRSISLTRNMGVENSLGEYILFIDDDEIASTEWLSHLLGTIKTFKVDGVFGRVIGDFNPETPKWMKKGDFFFIPVKTTGEKATHKYTTNCIIKASLLRGLKEPFKPNYGLTGGEDVELFDRLERQGARFIYSYEGFTSEYVPPSRSCLSFLASRRIRFGVGRALKRIEEFEGKKNMIRIFIFFKALCYGLGSLVFVLLCFPNKVNRMRWFLRVILNYGRLKAALGLAHNYEWYR